MLESCVLYWYAYGITHSYIYTTCIFRIIYVPVDTVSLQSFLTVIKDFLMKFDRIWSLYLKNMLIRSIKIPFLYIKIVRSDKCL